jgi:hypothetical protein
MPKLLIFVLIPCAVAAKESVDKNVIFGMRCGTPVWL